MAQKIGIMLVMQKSATKHLSYNSSLRCYKHPMARNRTLTNKTVSLNGDGGRESLWNCKKKEIPLELFLEIGLPIYLEIVFHKQKEPHTTIRNYLS